MSTHATRPTRSSGHSRRLALVAMILLMAALSWRVLGQTSEVKAIELSAEPLHIGAPGHPPTLTLAMAIGHPLLGARHPAPDYDVDDTYPGYFDAEGCYAYLDAAEPMLRRFDRIGAARAHGCQGTGFSGNLMNWATASALDLLRLGLTGGDRIVDTPELTVLQRAVPPPHDGGAMPRRRLAADAAAQALPQALRGDWKGDVFIGDCPDGIGFGTRASAGCTPSGDPDDLGVARPGVQGDPETAHGSTPLARDRFFQARVRVCESDARGELLDPRSDLCVRQPAGNFKPLGHLQRQADRLRVAVFGLLMDESDTRHGGVLRAPMKFLGPERRDEAGVPQPANLRMEWDPATGVLVTNPEDVAEGASGVLNYLNHLGRGGSVPGRYRQRAPIGELYDEALRYLRGLAPTSQAGLGLTADLKDGFPVHERWDDPHAGGSASRDHACLHDHLLLIGDGHTYLDASMPGRQSTDPREFARPAGPGTDEPDVAAWTRVVGGFESDTRVAHPDDPTRATSNPNPAGSPAAPWPEATAIGIGHDIAGLAYWAGTHDIRGAAPAIAPDRRRPGLRVTTHVLDIEADGNGEPLDRRRRTPLFLAAKYGGFIDRSGIGHPFVDARGQPDNSAWEHPNRAGDPRTYHLAGDAAALLGGLDEVFAGLGSRGQTIATGDVPATALAATAPLSLYRASFDSDRWHGDVRAVPLALDASGRVVAGDDGAAGGWSAAARLDAPTLDPDRRRIFIGRVDMSRRTADEFRWPLLEGDADGHGLRQSLDRASATAPPDGLGARRVAFLRGDRRLEGVRFRRRASRLGDFVHSGVAFDEQSARGPTTVFAGANDGMLHAFDATTGDERFAYIPSWLGPHLATLTAPAYDAGLHRGYVDATPRVARADWPDGSRRTVLVGGTGSGGQGVYALDVGDPAAFDASRVLWEFTDRDDPALGHVTGRPWILRFRTSAADATGAPTHRSFAVVASGVGNAAPDGHATTDGAPAIFLLDLAKPVGTPWKLGANYFRLSVPVDAMLAARLAPGILDLAPVIGQDGAVQALYFGDLHGRLWKLDFSRQGSTGWTTRQLSPFVRDGIAWPLFTARDGPGDTGRPQPISAAPHLLAGPGHSVLVAFGTGRYLERDDDPSSTTARPQTQSIYVLLDDATSSVDGNGSAGHGGQGGGPGDGAIAGRARLVAGSARDGTITVPPFAWGRPSTDDDTTRRAGWYVDLPAAGERQIGELATFGRTLVFASLIPPGATNEVCDAGSGHVYQVDLVTGDGNFRASTVGVPATPLVLRDGPSAPGAVDAGGRGITTTRARIVGIGSAGIDPAIGGDVALPPRTQVHGMLSWRRIHNHQDLRHARD